MTSPTDMLTALRRGDLAGTTDLTLSCGLTELPDEVAGLADTLEVLDLTGNALTALPPWFPRLRRLRALFCSGNRFRVLPPELGGLPELSQVAFRGVGLREIPDESLPPKLRWLTLTDNALATVPQSLGERPLLQKLLLAGNRLSVLPAELRGAERLELIRLAANRFETLPSWLAELPALAWLAWSANPFEHDAGPVGTPPIPWRELELGDHLGEGASGRVHRAVWRPAGGAERGVAVKLFKGAMTSDGLPRHEMAACLSAGAHAGLTGALGAVEGCPDGAEGLVMPLLPSGWRVLAAPPSRESCSRDVYAPELRLTPDAALRIARDVAGAAAHLHGRGLMHGDLYAHNILWDGGEGAAVLSDFGAASFLPTVGEPGRWTGLDVLAFGRLLGELLDRCDDAPAAARALESACVRRTPGERPAMADALAQLDALGDRR